MAGAPLAGDVHSIQEAVQRGWDVCLYPRAHWRDRRSTFSGMARRNNVFIELGAGTVHELIGALLAAVNQSEAA